MPSRSLARPRARRPLALFAAAPLLVVAVLLSILPASLSPLGATQALAKSYECPRVDTTAQVQTDGSLHVVEQRTFAFDGSFTVDLRGLAEQRAGAGQRYAHGSGG